MTRRAASRLVQLCLLTGVATLVLAGPAWATCTVSTNAASGAGSLRQAILDLDMNACTNPIVINAGVGTITLGAASGDLPAITTSATITGNGNTLDGGGTQRGLFAYSGTIAINDLTIQNTKAQGGTGGGGGGGGAGLGGALFVASGASVTATNLNLANNTALGGAGGGATTIGGGGGMGGDGGNAGGGGGGGGGVGTQADGGTAGVVTGNPGVVGIVINANPGGAGGAGAGGTGGAGGLWGGGGGGGAANGGGGGGGVGGGGGNGAGGGGAGGFGGGGGGGFGGGGGGAGGFGGGGGTVDGAGGFGGGGGGGINNPAGGFGGGGGGGAGGAGGMGAGGAIFVQQGGSLTIGGTLTINGSSATGGAGAPGTSGTGTNGAGGFGAGNGAGTINGGAGGGLGAGGAIFVQAGGSLTIGGAGLIDAGLVTGGTGGAGAGTGSAFGSGIFLSGNGAVGSLNFSPGPAEIRTVVGAIADQSGSGGTGGNAGSWGLTQSGDGTLVLSGANTYTGATTVTAGTLQAGAVNTFAPTSAHSVTSPAVIDLNDKNQIIGSLAGDGNVTLGSGALTTGGNGSSTTFSGGIAGSGSVTKSGAGTLSLSGTNTYSGVTSIVGGTLAVNGSLSSGGPGVSVGAGGTLGGTGTVGGFASLGTVAPGNSVGTLHSGAALLLPVSDFAVEIDGGGADRLDVSGTVDVSGSTLNLTLLGSYAHTPGTVYTIMANDGSDPVAGTFAGLPGGATINIGGKIFTISYTGGSNGNDITLKAGETPSLATNASAGVAIGGQVHDTATVSGGISPTGQLSFKLYGPGDVNCSGTPAFTDTKPVAGNGSYQSSDFTTTQAGVHRWTVDYSGDTNNSPAASPCNAVNESVTVSASTPALATSASPDVVLGGAVHDTATLSGGSSPTGQITFRLFGPDDANCSGSPVFTNSQPVSGAGATSADFVPTAPGTYRWTASYSGDANNDPTSAACNEGSESVTVSAPPQKCHGEEATIVVEQSGRTTKGTKGPDVIVGTNGADEIKALEGDDVVCGRGGGDKVLGGKGRDDLSGGDGSDFVQGKRDADTISGDAGADELRGGGGADELSGGDGNDRILGAAANDRLNGNAGHNKLNGGNGHNTCVNGPVLIHCRK